MLESASGLRVWELLKFLSDYTVRWELARLHGGEIPSVPDCIMSLEDYKREKVRGKAPHFVKDCPAVANIDPSVLMRNRIGIEAATQAQIQRFRELSRHQVAEKKKWVEFSKKLAKEYEQA